MYNKEKNVSLDIDAGRLLYGLSRIGYTTSSAICDIIDNSVRAKAKNIWLLIRKEKDYLGDRKRNNVKEYIIIDDGEGMSDKGIQEALKLGSTDIHYEEGSLSKFGLGLKAAAFSQADTLKVISSDGEEFCKYEVSLPNVIKEKKYFAIKKELDADDNELIEQYLKGNQGTIVKISDVRLVNHPSVRSTVKELNKKVGVIYYYFFKESNIKIFIGDNEIEGIDPLFTEEATGNLNEHNWDGKTVKWIEKSQKLLIDDETDIHVNVEITQLPYPPIFKVEKGKGADAKIREKYLIGSGNYGFYVYRNKRLISWAASLSGIIPMQQEYFAFRGRILIEDDADEYFNIDVKKMNLNLSDEAWNTISDFVKEGKSKSRKAWSRMTDHLTSITNKQPNEISNDIIDDFEQPDLLPGDTVDNRENQEQRLLEIQKDMEEKAKRMAEIIKDENKNAIKDPENLTKEEKELAIKGEDNLTLKRIFRVSHVQDNNLWEPYYDTDLGDCVRINKYHRFAKLLFQDNSENKDLQIIAELLLLQLAEAEIYSYKNIDKYTYDELKRVLSEYRKISSDFLANMCRKLEDHLPPNYKSLNRD